ncbi:MAG: hypothetical protein H0V44_05085 [Planctomycetes bacterium]|nr:hypothetical protein [Planctomycetota bacterium]
MPTIRHGQIDHVHWNTGRLKKQVTIAASVAGLFLFAIGILAFIIALRPCRLAFEPGQVVSYRLTSTTCEILQDGRRGPARAEERLISLVCTGPDNEVALISTTPGSGRRDRVSLLDFSPEGTAYKLDTAARPSDVGVAIGFFDFNLMPLPAGSEQPKDVSITYAALPPGRNPVQGKVRRTKSGTKPVFQLKLRSSVEWLVDNHYHQVRNLVSTYRFNTAKGVVDQATIKLIAGIEREDRDHHFEVEMALELDGPIRRSDEDPRRLRDAVLASAEAEDVLDGDRRERFPAVAERLRVASIGLPQLRAITDRLISEIQNPGAPPDPKSFAVRLATGPARERAGAETLARKAIAAGYRVYFGQPTSSQLSILIGPYPAPDPVVISALARAFPDHRPEWIEVPR